MHTGVLVVGGPMPEAIPFPLKTWPTGNGPFLPFWSIVAVLEFGRRVGGWVGGPTSAELTHKVFKVVFCLSVPLPIT